MLRNMIRSLSGGALLPVIQSLFVWLQNCSAFGVKLSEVVAVGFGPLGLELQSFRVQSLVV